MTDTKRDHRSGDVDPAEAFEALRQTVTDLHGVIEAQNRHRDAELAIIRKSIESALKQLAAIQEPVDYTADMARMVKSLDGVARRLKAIEGSAVLQFGPQESARIMADAGEGQIRSAVRKLEIGADNLIKKTREIGRYVRRARYSETQNRLYWATFLVVTSGVLFSVVFLLWFLYRYLWFPISQWLQ